MQIITWSGVLFFIFAVILAIQTLVNFCTGKAADGFSTVILLLLIIGSILMLGIGIMGYYLSKIYEEIKQRPKNQDADKDARIINNGKFQRKNAVIQTPVL